MYSSLATYVRGDGSSLSDRQFRRFESHVTVRWSRIQQTKQEPLTLAKSGGCVCAPQNGTRMRDHRFSGWKYRPN
jgi:hypothetical protein